MITHLMVGMGRVIKGLQADVVLAEDHKADMALAKDSQADMGMAVDIKIMGLAMITKDRSIMVAPVMKAGMVRAEDLNNMVMVLAEEDMSHMVMVRAEDMNHMVMVLLVVVDITPIREAVILGLASSIDRMLPS